jgi:phosphoribosylformylglycinamidine (FGAM) synthase PurS component
LKKIISKNITIEYYSVNSLKKIEEKRNTYQELPIDITPFLEKMKSMNVKERRILYNGEFIFLQSIEKNINTGLWELIFYKTTSASVPEILNNDGEITKILELNDDENLTQEVCMIYDSKSMISILQRNVFAINTKGIETFINSYMINYPIKFKIFSNESTKKTILSNKANVKRIRIGIHIPKSKRNKTIVNYERKSKLTNIINNAMDTQCGIINLELSMGNTKDFISLQEEDFGLFEELLNNEDIKKMEIGTINELDSAMQITDFIDVRIKDIINIKIEKGKTIDKKILLEKMYEKYLSNRSIR